MASTAAGVHSINARVEGNIAAGGINGGNREKTISVDSLATDEGIQQQTDEERRAGLISEVKRAYGEFIEYLIHPPRAPYNMIDLGPAAFKIGGVDFVREDLTVRNLRGNALACSYWRPKADVKRERDGVQFKRPVVIYLHGQGSCRAEATMSLTTVLISGAAMFAFDFSGAGMSEGEFVSLGFYERDDLQSITNFLMDSGKVSCIGLWGHSMGASTALMFAPQHEDCVKLLVCDSAFSDIRKIADDLVANAKKQGAFIPKIAVSLGISVIVRGVKKRTHFSLRDLAPIKRVHECGMLALFLAGEQDQFITAQHSKDLHAKYGGNSELMTFKGDHNTTRPHTLFDTVSRSITDEMVVPYMDSSMPLIDDAYDINLVAVHHYDRSPNPPWHTQEFSLLKSKLKSKVAELRHAKERHVQAHGSGSSPSKVSFMREQRRVESLKNKLVIMASPTSVSYKDDKLGKMEEDQIEILCENVQDNVRNGPGTMARGCLNSTFYMLKNKKIALKMMKRRVCFLVGRRLIFNREENIKYGTAAHTRREFDAIEVSDWDGSVQSTQYPNGFQVKTEQGRTLFISAGTMDEKLAWMKAIKHGVAATEGENCELGLVPQPESSTSSSTTDFVQVEM